MPLAVVADTRDGLTRALEDGVHRGWLEAQAGYSRPSGAYGRLEAGYRLAPSLGAFGFGQVDQANGPQGGIGLRWVF